MCTCIETNIMARTDLTMYGKTEFLEIGDGSLFVLFED